MKNQKNRHWQSLLPAAIAIVILLGAASTTSAQKSLNAKYPKPDFSAMEEFWEIISYEYDFTTNGTPKFTVVVKKKQEKAPRAWDVTWYDGDGVKVGHGFLGFDTLNQTKVGENARATAICPWKNEMEKVTKVVATDNGSF